MIAYRNEADKVTHLPHVMKYITGKILDIGCGDGRITEDAFGVDGRTLPGVGCVTDNPYDINFIIGSNWDTVFSSHFLEHLYDQYGAVSDWIKCVKPGGYLVLYLPDGRHYDNHENKEHMVDMNYDDFIFWFKRTFCGEGMDFRGHHMHKVMHLVDSGLDVGEQRYSFYVIARKPIDTQLIFPGVEGTKQVYMDCLRTLCGDTAGKSMIDICCNTAPHTPLLWFKTRQYIDIEHRNLDWPEEQKYFLKMDALELEKHLVLEKTDVMICSDGIEHFNKLNGYKLLEQMERCSHKQILFTPLGDHMVEDGDNPQAHHSGWIPQDMPGYATIVFPDYHRELGLGAFFAIRTENLKESFNIIADTLNAKDWAQ